MPNQPQCPIEEIELIPHPMDTWRAALTALIACAPGDGAAIAAHLAEASEQALVFVDRTYATPGVNKMVDRLMLIGASKLDASDSRSSCDLGFCTKAAVIGISYPEQAVQQSLRAFEQRSDSSSRSAAIAQRDCAGSAPAPAHLTPPGAEASPPSPLSSEPNPQPAPQAHQNPDRS